MPAEQSEQTPLTELSQILWRWAVSIQDGSETPGTQVDISSWLTQQGFVVTRTTSASQPSTPPQRTPSEQYFINLDLALQQSAQQMREEAAIVWVQHCRERDQTVEDRRSQIYQEYYLRARYPLSNAPRDTMQEGISPYIPPSTRLSENSTPQRNTFKNFIQKHTNTG